MLKGVYPNLKDLSPTIIVERWKGPFRPKFAGVLTDYNRNGTGNSDVCRCAQGDILHVAGMNDRDIIDIDQDDADCLVAELLGIPVYLSIILRNVNDSTHGCPEDVLDDPTKIFGRHWVRIVNFCDYAEELGTHQLRHLMSLIGIDNAYDAAHTAGCYVQFNPDNGTCYQHLNDVLPERFSEACFAEILAEDQYREANIPFKLLNALGIENPARLDHPIG